MRLLWWSCSLPHFETFNKVLFGECEQAIHWQCTFLSDCGSLQFNTSWFILSTKQFQVTSFKYSATVISHFVKTLSPHSFPPYPHLPPAGGGHVTLLTEHLKLHIHHHQTRWEDSHTHPSLRFCYYLSAGLLPSSADEPHPCGGGCMCGVSEWVCKCMHYVCSLVPRVSQKHGEERDW